MKKKKKTKQNKRGFMRISCILFYSDACLTIGKKKILKT